MDVFIKACSSKMTNVAQMELSWTWTLKQLMATVRTNQHEEILFLIGDIICQWPNGSSEPKSRENPRQFSMSNLWVRTQKPMRILSSISNLGTQELGMCSFEKNIPVLIGEPMKFLRNWLGYTPKSSSIFFRWDFPWNKPSSLSGTSIDDSSHCLKCHRRSWSMKSQKRCHRNWTRFPRSCKTSYKRH